MYDHANGAAVNILLVDDDRICREGVKRALRKAAIENPIFEAANGIEALDYLQGRNGRGPIPGPLTILLDLNMPQMTGHEFLEHLRADPVLHDANVFVITTSVDEIDLRRCYHKNVAGYVVKSHGPAPYADLAQMLREYWQVVKLA